MQEIEKLNDYFKTFTFDEKFLIVISITPWETNYYIKLENLKADYLNNNDVIKIGNDLREIINHIGKLKYDNFYLTYDEYCLAEWKDNNLPIFFYTSDVALEYRLKMKEHRNDSIDIYNLQKIWYQKMQNPIKFRSSVPVTSIKVNVNYNDFYKIDNLF